MLVLWTRFACFARYIHLFCCIWSMNRLWCRLVLLLPKLFWTCTILTKNTCRVLTHLHHFDILNPPLFWHLYIVLTNQHHLYTDFHENFEQTKQHNKYSGQSKQSEFTRIDTSLARLVLILRYVTKVDVMSPI